MNTIASLAAAAGNVKARIRGYIAPVVAAIERTRYGRVAVALGRFAWKRLPKWLRRALAVCVAIPGPQDEAVALVVVAAWLLGTLVVSAGARSELAAAVSVAWRGQR